jgi:hypothetical protein
MHAIQAVFVHKLHSGGRKTCPAVLDFLGALSGTSAQNLSEALAQLLAATQQLLAGKDIATQHNC